MPRLRIGRSVLQVFLLWIGWAVVLTAFQHLVVSRFQPARPDRVLEWTAQYTQDDPLQRGDQALDGSFRDFYPDLRVAWDSGFYLSIATKGYDDPDMPAVQGPGGERVSLNYAFMPLYPLSIRAVALVLQPLGMGRIQTPIYAGVLVSLLGTLAGLLALYDLGKHEGSPDDGTRAAFYMLIFPAGFFLAQVYSEGLFVGLAFGCLALVRRKLWIWAALLAALATLTRTVGAGLAVSLVVALLLELRSEWVARRMVSWRTSLQLAVALVPVAVFLGWYFSPLGQRFGIADAHFFGRQPFALEQSWNAWKSVLAQFTGGNRLWIVYYVLEIAALALAFAACIGVMRRHLPVALFGLLAWVAVLTSGVPQSMIRYMVSIPALYLFLSRLGRNQVFDRLWTLLSLLLMGLLLALFTFEMWVG